MKKKFIFSPSTGIHFDTCRHILFPFSLIEFSGDVLGYSLGNGSVLRALIKFLLRAHSTRVWKNVAYGRTKFNTDSRLTGHYAGIFISK